MAETGTYVKIMRESLDRKKLYLSEILELTQEQGSLAREEVFQEDRFLEIVDRKEILIQNINEIDKGFSSVYDRVRSEVREHQDLYREELLVMQESIKACVELGLQIEATEERNRLAMEQVFANSFNGLRQVKQSKTIANKYYKSMSNGMVNDSFLYDQKK